METSLLTTKLNITPAHPQTVPRSRLIERLQEGRNYSLVLISAPAGFGKTTVLSEWIHIRQPLLSVAWFSIEESENDPSKFWEYSIAALQTIYPDFGERLLQRLRSVQMLSPQSIITPLVNELAAISQDFFLVLDDYHFIQTKAVHTDLTFLLDHLPPRMHLVIASRTDPLLYHCPVTAAKVRYWRYALMNYALTRKKRRPLLKRK